MFIIFKPGFRAKQLADSRLISSRTFWLLLILFLSLVLRVYDLAGESIWVDEGRSLDIARHSIPEILRETSQDNPPVYSIILHYWITMFGSSEFSGRFLSLIFSVFSVWILYLIGVKLFDRRTGLLAALFMALSVFQIQYAQEIRSYSLLGLLTLLSYYYFIRLLKNFTKTDTIIYILLGALLLYTHYLGVMILLAQFFYLIIQFRRSRTKNKPPIGRWFLIYAAIAFLYLPWFGYTWYQIIYIQTHFWVPSPTILALPQTLLVYSGTYTIYGVITFLLFMILVLLPLFRRRSGQLAIQEPVVNRLLLLYTWFIIPILIPWLFSYLVTPIYIIRITIPATSAFYLLLAIGWQCITLKRIRWVIITSVVILSLANIYLYYHEQNKERWREAVALVESRARPGDLVIVHIGSCIENTFDYYSRRTDLTKIPFPSTTLHITAADIDSLPVLTRNRQQVWLVLSHSRDSQQMIVKKLSREYNMIIQKPFISKGFNSHKPYTGVEVFLFAKSIAVN